MSARSSFFEKGILLTKPFQASRADISCHFLKKGSWCRTVHSINGLYVSLYLCTISFFSSHFRFALPGVLCCGLRHHWNFHAGKGYGRYGWRREEWALLVSCQLSLLSLATEMDVYVLHNFHGNQFPFFSTSFYICILILISNSLLLPIVTITRNTVASKCATAMMEPKIDLILAQKSEKCENCSFLLKN